MGIWCCLENYLFETVSRLSGNEKMVSMEENSRKLDMGYLKKQGFSLILKGIRRVDPLGSMMII